MYALGVIGGYSDGSFNGGGIMNRGQAAAVIYRMTQAVPVEAPAPETPAVPAPETPEAPAPETPSTSAAGTLTNGKPITVENVTELMNELRAQYPSKTDAGTYSGGPMTIRKITNKYSIDTGGIVSTSYACGGWAARVFDYIFDKNVTFRQVSYDEARVGDLLIEVDSQGYLAHVAIVSDRKTFNNIPNVIFTTDANMGGGVNVMLWDAASPDPDKYGFDWSYDIYTVYPD